MLVILTSYLPLYEKDPQYHIIELFAGSARIAKLGREEGLSVAALDISYDEKDATRFGKNSQDINSSPGYLSLSLKLGV